MLQRLADVISAKHGYVFASVCLFFGWSENNMFSTILF